MYRFSTSFSFVLVFCQFTVFAQDRPADFLSPEFHKGRREALRELMPVNSVAVFFSNPTRNRSNDVDYMYHQDPNFYYLTGHKEPHAVLLIFKEQQKQGKARFNEIIFVRQKNALWELYEGERLGKEKAAEVLGIEMALEGPDFIDYNPDFGKYSKVLFFDFMNDVRDENEQADLYELIESFKEKIGYNIKPTRLKKEPEKLNHDTVMLDSLLDILRGVKLEEELVLIRRAVDISAIAQREVMKAMRPGMSELEVQGMHEFIFRKYQAENQGYPSIVGAGHNGCVLHYIENYKPSIEDGELILMDLGAEYHGYTADVTRTIPVNGKFSPEQKAIYGLVLKAQEAAIAVCRAGVTFDDLYLTTTGIINQGLLELGIIEAIDKENLLNPATGRHWYYPHGCCHHIGLDVHDKGTYDELLPNMVITIEPGIYIPKGSPCDEKWWNIPVRIEDDFLVTKEGCEMLSGLAPRTVDEIEEVMQQSSAFNDFDLPELKK